MCFFNSYKKHPEAFIFQSCTYIDFNVIYGRPLIENPKDLEDLVRVASPSDCRLGGKAWSEGCSPPPTQRSLCWRWWSSWSGYSPEWTKDIRLLHLNRRKKYIYARASRKQTNRTEPYMVGELHLVVALWDGAEVGGKADRDIVRVHLGHLDHNMITCIHIITSLSTAALQRKVPSPSSFLHHNHHHHHDHLYCHHCNRNELGSCSWFIIWFTPLFLERSARREKRCDTTLGEAIWLHIWNNIIHIWLLIILN